MPQLVIVLLEAFNFGNNWKFKCLQKILCSYVTASDRVFGSTHFW